MHLLGFDIGSSSIKGCLLDSETGKVIASSVSPDTELEINSPKNGWAEQDPETWWEHVKIVAADLLSSKEAKPGAIKGIGIAYQMHGLVLVDSDKNVLRPSIIWCDGRAVEIGKKAFNDLGADFCLDRYLNSPGNFTASKLRWVREHESKIFNKIHKAMLPGDYIAMKFTGEINTSVSGLSEGIFWDYSSGDLAKDLLDYYELPEDLLPDYKSCFTEQGSLSKMVAGELGLPEGIPVAYRSGDQPNNALSLNVLDPGEIAATAGTSGVIYGVTEKPLYDKKSRVNTFVHVNHTSDNPRYGVLLCINGTGIQNSWLKNRLLDGRTSYKKMNRMASDIPVGSDGVTILPFGNGPERVLQNRDPGALVRNINFNRHTEAHVIRAAQEGIAFSLNYGFDIMRQMGLDIDTIRVGRGNMFLSEVFREAFTNTTGVTVELYESSGALGSAIGAGIGSGVFSNRKEAFKVLEKHATLHPDEKLQEVYAESYQRWQKALEKEIKD